MPVVKNKSMNEEVIKYRTKYSRAVNALILIVLYTIFRLALFFVFEDVDSFYLIESSRLINILGFKINEKYNWLGSLTSVSLNAILLAGIIICWNYARKGNLKVMIGFLIFYFLDMFAYFYSHDLLSFVLHFIFLSYMLYGVYSYMKMYQSYIKNKEE